MQQKRLVIGLALTVILAGCATAKPSATQTPAATPQSAAQRAKEIDDMHAAGVKAFPAKTEGEGNKPLSYTMDGNTKVFALTVSKIQWETSPGKKVDAYAYNGMVPGPLLRVTEGDRVRVVVKNEMDESTAVHWHGLLVDNKSDGVPFITQDPIRSGETYTYEFTAVNPGTHMYHSHHNAVAQVTGGLLGALIVDPKDKAELTRYKEDVDVVMVLNDGLLGFTLNGKEFPATAPIAVKQGQRVRIRYMNEGQIIHPMHLHGLTMLVVEKDGYALPQPYKVDTLNVAPGERFDVIVEANNPGVWAFHCHILSHAESEHGMHGMVTVFIVE